MATKTARRTTRATGTKLKAKTRKSAVANKTLYNASANELIVEFNNGEIYKFNRVTPATYRKLNRAKSFGSALSRLVTNK